MGFELMNAGLMTGVAIHFHLTLISAHQYNEMESLELRDLVERAIFALTEIHSRSKQRIPLLPANEEYRKYFLDEDQYKRYDDYISSTDMVEVSTSNPEMITRWLNFSCGGKQIESWKANAC